MPHYADGTQARVGDVVKGKGYSLRDADGNLREIVGSVVGIVPESGSCNIRLLVMEQFTVPFGEPEQHKSVDYVHTHGQPKQRISPTLEYGQCDHFTKIL